MSTLNVKVYNVTIMQMVENDASLHTLKSYFVTLCSQEFHSVVCTCKLYYT